MRKNGEFHELPLEEEVKDLRELQKAASACAPRRSLQDVDVDTDKPITFFPGKN